MSTENLFLALLLDPALHGSVTRRIQASVREHGFTGKAIASERLHVSLLNFGSYDEQIAQGVCAIAQTIRFAPFGITFDTALSFRNRDRHPFVLTSERDGEGVCALQATLSDRFSGNSLRLGRPGSFTPHLTLLYDRKMILQHSLERPLSWIVRDFVLIRSYVRQSRYDILGRWPLVSRKAAEPQRESDPNSAS